MRRLSMILKSNEIWMWGYPTVIDCDFLITQSFLSLGIFFYLWWCNLIHDRWGAWRIKNGRRREWNCLKGAPSLLENWTYLRFWVLSPWKSQFSPFFKVPKNFFFHPEIPLKISCFFQHSNHIFLSTNSNSLFTNNTHKKWNIVP